MRKIINKFLLILIVISAVSCEVEMDFEFDKVTFEEQRALWNEKSFTNYSYVYVASKPAEDGSDIICEKYEVYVNADEVTYYDLLSESWEVKTENAERFRIENIYKSIEDFYKEHKGESINGCELNCSDDFYFYMGLSVEYDTTYNIPTIFYRDLAFNSETPPDVGAILFRIENFAVSN